MKKLVRKYGIMALILAVLWILCYVWADNMHGGIDMIGDAVAAAMFLVLIGLCLLVVLFLFLFEVFIFYAPKKGKIIASGILLGIYGLGMIYLIYSAFSFSYGRFFAYLKEGEIFSYLHVLGLGILLAMFLIRLRKLRRFQRS